MAHTGASGNQMIRDMIGLLSDVIDFTRGLMEAAMVMVVFFVVLLFPVVIIFAPVYILFLLLP